MGLGLQRPLLDLLQQAANSGLPIDIGLEHLGVDEETNQTLGFHTVAVGNRHANANVLLATVAVQQNLERGQQQHEQRYTFALGQGFEVDHQRRGYFYVRTRAAMALLRRALIIERQLQHRLLTAQQLAPVAQLTRLLARLHPLALPHCVIGILNRQWRQSHLLALAKGGVDLHQFLDHHLHRPTVGDDMVLHQHQYVIILGQAQQIHAQQRPLLQIEGQGDFRFHTRLQISFLDITVTDDHRRRLAHDLHGAIAAVAQHGAQTLMTGHQMIKAALQRANVQRPLQAQHTRHVIGAAVRVQLPEEPLALLGI